MKKVLFMMAVAVALSLTSCDGGKDYKAKGEEMSKQLDEQVEMNDTAAVLSSDEQIRQLEEQLIAAGDTLALADFRAAMKDARVRNAAFVTLSKIHNGMEKKDALQELMQDALNSDINIGAVTSAINAVLKAEGQAKKDGKQEKKEKK